MKFAESDVKKFAVEKNLPIYQPEKVKNNAEFVETIRNLKPDIMCVVAYGKILPKEILDIPKKGCINLHASLLPKYRGAAPIQWAVLNGDKTTGVTTMYMNEKMDEGDIILQEETKILEEETTGELWERLAYVGAELLVKSVKQVEEGTAPRTKQGYDFTLAHMLDKSMAKIDFSRTIDEIKNKVRGLNPIMGAYALYNNKKIKIWKFEKLSNSEASKDLNINIDENIIPGTILLASDKQGLYVKAKNGVMNILEVQGENAKKMSINDFLRGNKLTQRRKIRIRRVALKSSKPIIFLIIIVLILAAVLVIKMQMPKEEFNRLTPEEVKEKILSGLNYDNYTITYKEEESTRTKKIKAIL